jgi:hypothetical protein
MGVGAASPVQVTWSVPSQSLERPSGVKLAPSSQRARLPPLHE